MAHAWHAVPVPPMRSTPLARAVATFVAAVCLLLPLTAIAPTAASASSGSTTTSGTPEGTAGSTASPGVRDSVARLYLATFDRPADAEGLAYWVDLYVRGMPLTTVAEHFVASPEWAERYGPLGDEDFVTLLYRNVLDREPDRSGLEYWVSQLRSGHPRVVLLLGFSESPEFVEATGTAPPEAPPAVPFPAVPANSGQGFRIIYDNDRQRVWMVDQHDLIVDSYLVSGRRATPGPGVYEVFSKSERAWAGHDGITMNHMVRFAHGSSLAIGFHSIPRDRYGRPLQSESELGTYRSSGCVRQADHKAAALYAWAPIGTTVVVLP